MDFTGGISLHGYSDDADNGANHCECSVYIIPFFPSFILYLHANNKPVIYP